MGKLDGKVAVIMSEAARGTAAPISLQRRVVHDAPMIVRFSPMRSRRQSSREPTVRMRRSRREDFH